MTQFFNHDMECNDSVMTLYKLLLTSEFGLWIWEAESDALYFNANYMSMLGYEHKTLPFHISTWEQLIHPADREPTVEYQRNLLATPTLGDSFEAHFRMRSASGEYVKILGRGFVLSRDAAGKALRVCGMHIDQEEMETARRTLTVEHDRMLFALEAARDGLWDWDTVLDEVYFSPRYIAMFGYTAAEFPPRVESWTSRVHPDDLEHTVGMQYEHIRSPELGDVFECVYRFLTAEGSYKWVLGRGKIIRRDATGRATRIVGLHTDITELRAAQENLSQLLNLDSLTRLHSRYFFDTALNGLQIEDFPISIFYCDIDGLKMINDNLGHTIGDALLVDSAAMLQACVGRNAVTARLGGDEFAVLLRACPEDKARSIRDRITKTFARHNAKQIGMPLYLSVGLASVAQPMPAHKMLAEADKAMRTQKSANRLASLAHIKRWIEGELKYSITSGDDRLA